MLAELVESKQAGPADDLVSGLISARGGDERLGTQELNSTIFQLIVARHDTTTSLIGNSVVALLRNPDWHAPRASSLSGRCCSASPNSASPSPATELHWDHGDGLVLRGLSEPPVIPGPHRIGSLLIEAGRRGKKRHQRLYAGALVLRGPAEDPVTIQMCSPPTRRPLCLSSRRSPMSP